MVDDHPLFRDGLWAALATADEIDAVDETETVAGAIATVGGSPTSC